MATISSTGIGSGLDVQSILNQIVAAEREPGENRLNLKEANLQAELSAFGTLKGSISSFQSSLSKLSSATQFNNSKVTVSDDDILTASTSSIAIPGQYAVEVKSLAQSHSIASIAYDELDDVIGTGILTFSFGTTDYNPGTSFAANDDTYSGFIVDAEHSSESIVIDNTNNTVSGLRDAINSADIGVRATIVDDGTGFRLLITAEQGVKNSLQISVNEGGDAAGDLDTVGLSALAFNAGATNLEQTQAGQDAEISINGLTVFRDSNVIVGAIHGVILNIHTTNEGKPVQVNLINENIEQTKTNIEAFVSAFNEMAAVFSDLTKFNVDTGERGVLFGDTTARNIIQQTRREFSKVINNGSSYNSMSSIGITTNRDGTLALNSDKLTKALKDDFNSVAQLFYANANTTNNDVTYRNSTAKTQEGSYNVFISALATQGQYTSVPVSSPVLIDTSNNIFSLIVDGVLTSTISINAGLYNDMGILAQELENRINADSVLINIGVQLSVSYVSGAFQMLSSSYGSGSGVLLSQQNSSLGFTSDSISLLGSDIKGSIGGSLATGSGQLLTGGGKADGLQLEITGNATGSHGNVTFSRGMATNITSLFDGFLSDNGLITVKTDSIGLQISNISGEREELIRRVDVIEARYRKQFIALDVLLGRLQLTNDFLQQQLEGLAQLTNFRIRR